MSNETVQFTKRELQRLFFAPRFWGVAVAVSVVLGVAGPFGTFESLALLPRLAYWFAIAVATFFIGALFSIFVGRLLRVPPRAFPLRTALIGAVAAIPVTGFVAAVNVMLFDTAVSFADEFSGLVLYISAITAALTWVYALTLSGEPPEQPQAAPTGPTAPAAPQPVRPALVERLPPALRGKLVRLAMQDHYVEVHTDRGSTLVLMRMADAVRETDGVAGLQIHRSHWVALEAIAGTAREGGRLFVRLADGTRLPVSRSRMEALRAAGLA